MFASLEVHNSYQLRSYLMMGTGDERVANPGSLKKLEVLVRTVPTQQNALLFAKALANETWVPSGYQQRLFGGQLSVKKPRPGALPVLSTTTMSLLGASWGNGPILAASALLPAGRVQESKQMRLHARALQDREPKPSAAERVAFKGTKVVLLKEVFDVHTGRVQFAEVLNVVHLLDS
jgi:hypothetical protein